MFSNDRPLNVLGTITPSNHTQEDDIQYHEFDTIISEAVGTIHEIEKILERNNLFGTTNEVALVFPNTTQDEYVTSVADKLDRINYYVQGISLTTVASVGLLGMQQIYCISPQQ